MRYRLMPWIVGCALVAVLLGHGSAALATSDSRIDAGELCQGTGYWQFTPDGRLPFDDADACLNYAAQHGGTNSLISRASVLLTRWGKEPSVFAAFTVTGLAPDQQYNVTMSIPGYGINTPPLLFTADETGTYAGMIFAPATSDCAGGIKLFVRVTTLTGYFLGTNGTFLPC